MFWCLFLIGAISCLKIPQGGIRSTFIGPGSTVHGGISGVNFVGVQMTNDEKDDDLPLCNMGGVLKFVERRRPSRLPHCTLSPTTRSCYVDLGRMYGYENENDRMSSCVGVPRGTTITEKEGDVLVVLPGDSVVLPSVSSLHIEGNRFSLRDPLTMRARNIKFKPGNLFDSRPETFGLTIRGAKQNCVGMIQESDGTFIENTDSWCNRDPPVSDVVGDIKISAFNNADIKGSVNVKMTGIDMSTHYGDPVVVTSDDVRDRIDEATEDVTIGDGCVFTSRKGRVDIGGIVFDGNGDTYEVEADGVFGGNAAPPETSEPEVLVHEEDNDAPNIDDQSPKKWTMMSFCTGGGRYSVDPRRIPAGLEQCRGNNQSPEACYADLENVYVYYDKVDGEYVWSSCVGVPEHTIILHFGRPNGNVETLFVDGDGQGSLHIERFPDGTINVTMDECAIEKGWIEFGGEWTGGKGLFQVEEGDFGMSEDRDGGVTFGGGSTLVSSGKKGKTGGGLLRDMKIDGDLTITIDGDYTGIDARTARIDMGHGNSYRDARISNVISSHHGGNTRNIRVDAGQGNTYQAGSTVTIAGISVGDNAKTREQRQRERKILQKPLTKKQLDQLSKAAQEVLNEDKKGERQEKTMMPEKFEEALKTLKGVKWDDDKEAVMGLFERVTVAQAKRVLLAFKWDDSRQKALRMLRIDASTGSPLSLMSTFKWSDEKARAANYLKKL